jgi:UDPglucose 6-dehydrogenase
MGSVAWDFLNPEMQMIGTEDGTETGDAQELVDFYKTVIENDPRYVIGTWDECECIKVFYNTFISTKITLANMIQDVAMKQGNINVDVVTTALAESTKRIMGPQYMTAGMGDGGACHPRDNIALRFMAQELDLGYDIFDAIMNARQIQAENMAKFLVAQAKEHELPVLIHGVAYKPDVPYKDGSYSLLVAHYCEEQGYYPILVDPNTHPQRGPFKAVALLAHNANITYKYMSEQTQDLYCLLLEGSVVIDPWRQYKDERYKVIHYGNTRSLA